MGRVSKILKIRKSLVQNGGPKPHRKFQYSSSIRKRLKIRKTENCEKEESRHPKSNFGAFQNLTETSILNILTRTFLQ